MDLHTSDGISQAQTLEVFRRLLRSKTITAHSRIEEHELDHFRCVAKWPSPGTRLRPNVWVARVHTLRKGRVFIFDEAWAVEVAAHDLRRFRKDLSAVFVLFGQLAEKVEPKAGA